MNLLQSIARELDAQLDRRDAIVKEGRDILREAKKIIFLCHDGKLSEARKRLSTLHRDVRATEAKFSRPLFPRGALFPLYSEGSWCASVEEFLEAWFVYHFLTQKKIVEPTGLKPKAEVYVGALADSTGELVRLAVLMGAARDAVALQLYRKLILQVVTFMLPLHLTSQSRQKFDQAKRNLKRVEEIIYEVKIRS